MLSQEGELIREDDTVGKTPVIPHDRPAFLYLMRTWFIQTNRTSNTIPKIGDEPLDLHQLYIAVETLGGPEEVQAAGLWRLVAIKMGYATHEQNDPQLAQIATALAEAYVALLAPFDIFCMERMRAIGTGIQNNHINLELNEPAIEIGAPGGLLPGGDVNPMADPQHILAHLQTTLKDWLPELSGEAKLLCASQMDVPEMQRQGWPPERISVIQRFRPTLMEYQATFLRQQELQRLGQQEQQQQFAHAQVHQQQHAQQPQQAQQPRVNDHRSSIGRGSLPPNMQGHNFGMPRLKLPFLADAMKRAKSIVENIAREIEHTRRFQPCNVPEMQRVQMNQTVTACHPFAVEFERLVPIYFMIFDNYSQTRVLMEQAALFREQHRILQSGQQQYIMSLEEVQSAQNALRMATHHIQANYAPWVMQHRYQSPKPDVGKASMGMMQPRQQQGKSTPQMVEPPEQGSPVEAGPKAEEDVFDFSHYVNDTHGDDDPLDGTSGVDPLEADTPDLNTNKETPDSATDDIDHLGQNSPGKGEQLPAGGGGESLAGSQASTLGEGFWEAFNDGGMPEGTYFMGGGANSFN